jgi:hypothetical protein
MRFEMFICFIASLFWCSCNNTTITEKEIDEFISKYENVKFIKLKDVSISQRSKNSGKVVYVVGKGEGNFPVYFVSFDIDKSEITDINKKNLEKCKVQDYLTKDEIINAINVIRKNDFYFLAVDSFQNVYINPFYANEPPFLLRLKTNTGDSVLKKGYAYEIYKKNWYLNKTRRKE